MQDGEINANASRVNVLLFEDPLLLANQRQSFRWSSIRGNCSRFPHERSPSFEREIPDASWKHRRVPVCLPPPPSTLLRPLLPVAEITDV